MNGLFQTQSIADIMKQVLGSAPGVLSDNQFVQTQAPMQMPSGVQPTVPQNPQGILNNPQPNMVPPSQPAQDAQEQQGVLSKIGNAFAINRDNFGNRIGNGLIAAGSLDPAKAFANLEAADDAGKIKYNAISGTPYFWYYKQDGSMAVVDAEGKQVQASALESYLKQKAENELNMFKAKTDYKTEADVGANAQKAATKTGLEQASEIGSSLGQANELRAIANELQGTAKDKVPATGPVAGLTASMLPNAVGSMVMPQSTKLRQDAERIIQNSLRATLGAQFTEKEGIRFLERAYNPSLPVADNVKRLNDIANELEMVATNKEAAVEYVKKNGTLEGFKPGVTPSGGGISSSSIPGLSSGAAKYFQ